MAISDLEQALNNLDAQIATITASLAAVQSGTVSADGMAVTHRRLDVLIKAREDIRDAIARDGGGTFVKFSQWVP